MLLPHVSILTHACNQCSENVYVCFHDSDMVIDSMVASGQLKEDLRNKVREAMLKKHHHQNERKLSNRIPLVRSFADIGKKHSDPLLLERNGETLNMHSHFLFLPVFDRWGTVAKKKKITKHSNPFAPAKEAKGRCCQNVTRVPPMEEKFGCGGLCQPVWPNPFTSRDFKNQTVPAAEVCLPCVICLFCDEHGQGGVGCILRCLELQLEVSVQLRCCTSVAVVQLELASS